MAVKKVLRLGNPLLRQKSLAIDESEVKTKDFKKLIKDMFETMRFENGIGLAAPQIGILKRVVIVGIEEENPRYPDAPKIEEHILINPIITPLEEPEGGYWEGCLSVPGMRGFVERPKKIKLEYMNKNLNDPSIKLLDNEYNKIENNEAISKDNTYILRWNNQDYKIKIL